MIILFWTNRKRLSLDFINWFAISVFFVLLKNFFFLLFPMCKESNTEKNPEKSLVNFKLTCNFIQSVKLLTTKLKRHYEMTFCYFLALGQ